MSLASLLLRLVLCASLVANGAGFAHATARMQPSSVPAPGMTVHVTANAAAGSCHEVGSSADARAPSDVIAGGEAMDDAGTQAMDCCEADACQCSCMAQASVAHAGMHGPQVIAASAVGLAGDASRHRPPRLPHLIRPPIG